MQTYAVTCFTRVEEPITLAARTPSKKSTVSLPTGGFSSRGISIINAEMPATAPGSILGKRRSNPGLAIVFTS